MNQIRIRLTAWTLCFLLFAVSFPSNASAAPDWPANISIQAEGGIVMDAATGTVLWGQNIHSQYFPASITKIMTALLVIENCSMDEMVTFSHNAVYNVEAGSSNASINEGDTLSVKDCLYALLLKSANESANALAEHIAGTTEQFAQMMNDKARELGCKNTHFNNPSGLNDPDHYTSPYDMALISRAAFSNPVFAEIDSATYYKLPPNAINPDGLTIYPGHKMLRKNNQYYYPGILGGKTGYTTLAGNTLVTCAEKNGMKLVAVILKGTTPQYWTDTKNLLDFGFENFQSVKIADNDSTYGTVASDLNIGNLGIEKPPALILDPSSTVILPKTAAFTDADAVLTYDVSKGDPPNSIAKIMYRYNDREIGCTYLEINGEVFDLTAADTPTGQSGTKGTHPSPQGTDSTLTAPADAVGNPAPPSDQTESSEGTAAPAIQNDSDFGLKPFEIPKIAWTILICFAALFAAGGGIVFFLYSKRGRVDQDYLARHEQRIKRLQDSGVSADEFNSLLEQRRSSYTSKRKSGRRHNRSKFK